MSTLDVVSWLTNLINFITKVFNTLWPILIEFVQLPFGLGPLAKYALPFNTFMLLVFFIIIGYKYRLAIDPLNDILNDVSYNSQKAGYHVRKYYQKNKGKYTKRFKRKSAYSRTYNQDYYD